MAGCSDWDDTVESSPEVSEGNPAVRFINENPSTFEHDPLVSTSFTLTVTRDDETNALEVPVVVVENQENGFVIPNSVSFAAGSKTADLVVSIADGAPKGIELALEIKIDDASSNPYRTEYATYYGKIVISDWADYSAGTYYSWWYEESFAQALQYSPAKEQYRFRNLMSEGVHFVFTWDGENEITPVPKTIETGMVHSTYGMVSATTNAASYDAGTKTFTFTRKWTVSAGSFGEGDDTYTMD